MAELPLPYPMRPPQRAVLRQPQLGNRRRAAAAAGNRNGHTNLGCIGNSKRSASAIGHFRLSHGMEGRGVARDRNRRQRRRPAARLLRGPRRRGYRGRRAQQGGAANAAANGGNGGEVFRAILQSRPRWQRWTGKRDRNFNRDAGQAMQPRLQQRRAAMEVMP